MDLLYKSTRSKSVKIEASKAIVKGLADDGGLYVPTSFPKLDKDFKEISAMGYKQVAYYVMNKFLKDFTEEELKNCIEKAYDEKFDTELIAPIVKKEDVYFLELFHGATLAFKDMALSILPHLLKTSIKKQNIDKEVVILTATSGDTGKAALEGFDSVDGTSIIVFFPENGVSEVQKRQMVTQAGENTHVVGIHGNFDDAQTAIKDVLNDTEFKKLLDENNYMFSSANSINIGRLIPQVVYYVNTYAKLLKDGEIQDGEKINVVVPTGNFGNILAAYYAKKMGTPIGKLICASNQNNVLTDFINTGVYDRRREFLTTISPSMDILVSSNLERLLFELSGSKEEAVKEMMDSLKEKGVYEISADMKKSLEDFYGGYADDEDTLKAIESFYEKTKYVMDTHTAVAYSVYEKYKAETGDTTKSIIASTASPFKFPKSVNDALNFGDNNMNDFELIEKLAQFAGIEVPSGAKDLDKKEIKHTKVCQKDEIKKTISEILGV